MPMPATTSSDSLHVDAMAMIEVDETVGKRNNGKVISETSETIFCVVRGNFVRGCVVVVAVVGVCVDVCVAMDEV